MPKSAPWQYPSSHCAPKRYSRLQITMDKLAVMGCPVSCAPTPISWPFTKASRSELIWSALVVGMPCGKLVQLLVQIA